MAKLKPSDLKPVDWTALTPHYRAGIRSLANLGAEFGVTPAAIIKHFRKRGVTRDLKARIVAQAQAKVNAAVVNEAVNANGVHQERAIVDANANVLASVQIPHRTDIARARKLVRRLLAELEAVSAMPDLFGMESDALSGPDKAADGALRVTAHLAARTKI